MEHIRKTAALCLIRQGIAEIIAHRVIRRRTQRLIVHCSARVQTPVIYIPEKMPPREIPNTFFQEPQSYQWQLDHRTVTFIEHDGPTSSL